MSINSKTYYAILVFIGVLISAVSTYMHHPETPVLMNNFGFKYSDVVYGVFYTRFDPSLYRDSDKLEDLWYNPQKYRELVSSGREYPIPYLDYKFEYPPVVGLTWFVSTSISIHLTLPEKHGYRLYRERFKDLASTHFLVQSILGSSAFILLLVTLSKLVVELGLSRWRIIAFSVMPSTMLYLTYNWDILCISFLVLGMYFFYKRRYWLTGLFLGLSIGVKLIPALLSLTLLLYILVETRKNKLPRRSLKSYVSALTLSTITPFLLLFILSPIGFTDFLLHHSRWYCENCIYQLIDQNIFSDVHRVGFASSLILVLSLTGYVVFKEMIKDYKQLLEIGLVSLMAGTVLNYVFSPQMLLLLSPLALLVLDKRKLSLFVRSDICNSLIMIFFFKDRELRAFLNNMGIPIKVRFNPWTLSSPVQWIAMARNILLLVVMAWIIYETLHRYRRRTG